MPIAGVALPTHWDSAPLKCVTSLLNRGSAPNYTESGPVRAISQAANQDAGIDWSRTRFHDYSGDATGLKGYLERNDVIINSTGTGTLGRVGYFEGSPDEIPCMADGHITVARFSSDTVHPRFAYYWMRSKPFREHVYSTLTVGATNQIELNRDRLATTRVPVPPLPEQRRISEFLDAEIGKINDLVSKKGRFLALLEERIDSRILEFIGSSRLVTNSGVPVSPIRNLLTKLTRPSIIGGEMVTAFRDGQVVARSLRRAEGYTLSRTTEAQGQRVEAGDVVIHGLDGFAGAIGTSESTGNCSPVYHVCIPRDNGSSLFYGRLLRVLAVSEYLGLFAISTRERAVDFRNWDLFGRIPVPVVPKDEQEEVASWISSLRPLRATVERSSALANERRQALITAAATGQIDVSTASGRGIED